LALTKVCPQCGSVEHCRRSACGKCGFVFCSAAKKNIVRESRENESEMECDFRRESDRQSKARKRATESELDSVERRASDRQCKAKRRANKTEQLSEC